MTSGNRFSVVRGNERRYNRVLVAWFPSSAWEPEFGGKYSVLDLQKDTMQGLPQELLSAALHVKWEHGHSEDERAVEVIALRVPGFSPDQYSEASRPAAALDSAAYKLAAAWFAGQGVGPTMVELKARYPGFSWDDYGEAVENNILWARK
jgi:hypothetical protein